MSEKICPLAVMGYYANSDGSANNNTTCAKEKCAWWAEIEEEDPREPFIAVTKGCAIKLIAEKK